MEMISSSEIPASLICGIWSSWECGKYRLLFMHGVPVWEGQNRPFMSLRRMEKSNGTERTEFLE
jgi:hypothetical protein